MLSGKLICLIENHEREITADILRSIHRDPELLHLKKLPELDVRERCQEILENLGYWLAHGHDEKLAREYEAVGKLRFEEAVPLDQCVRGICLMKDRIIAFLDAQGIDPDSLALYAEGQLVRRIGPFFDLLVIHLVRGYETARRHTVQSMHAA